MEKVKYQGLEPINKLTLSLGLFFVIAEFTYLEIKVGINISNMALAVIPALLVLSITRWLATPEMVKNRALALAFANGALVSFALATIFSVVVSELIPIPGYIIAGVTEESVKGFVITYLLRFWGVRYRPAQVLILGLSLGAGFAFSENMLYFTSARSAEKLGLMFIGRGLVTPFAHPLFTAIIAYAVGLWMSRPEFYGKKILLRGFALAAFIHSLYDWSTSFLSVLALSISVIALVFIELFLERSRRAENKVINKKAIPYIEFLPTIDREILLNLKERAKAQKFIAKESLSAFKSWIAIWRELILADSFNPELDMRHAYILLTDLKKDWSPGYQSARHFLLENIDLNLYRDFLLRGKEIISTYTDLSAELEVIDALLLHKSQPEQSSSALEDFNYKDQPGASKDDPFGLDLKE